MGTLTANQERLTAYCEHKLPTSCRLSSIPQCCACADERAHSSSYSVYIDGIGFVPRGTRWQRYCWFCKEFWENRVAMSGLLPAQTRIPQRPGQTAFLERWYEFHRGYRIVQKEDGSEERIAVLGEDFSQVSPGHLPRTLAEMRAGHNRSQHDVEAPQEQAQEEPRGVEEQTLDSAFEEMLAAAAEEEASAALDTRHPRQASPERSTQLHSRHNRLAQVMNPAGSRDADYQLRRVAALHRELDRMRSGIERVVTGLRELGENVPDFHEVRGRLAEAELNMDIMRDPASLRIAENSTLQQDSAVPEEFSSQSNRSLQAMQARVQAARQVQQRAYERFQGARRARDQAVRNYETAERENSAAQQHLTQLRREQRTMENYTRLFGTREEMAAQGEEYVSPIGAMFNRAYERFRAAEEVRREERTLRQVLEDEAVGDRAEALRRLMELAARPRDVWGVPRTPSAPATDSVTVSPEEMALQEYYALIRRQERSSQAGTAEMAPLPTDTDPAATQVSSMGVEAEFACLRATASDVRIWIDYLRHHAEPDDNRITLLNKLLSQEQLTDDQTNEIEALLHDPTAFLSGVAASIIARRRQAGEIVTFTSDGSPSPTDCISIQLMAESFQMSVELRQRARTEFDVSVDEEVRILENLQSQQRDSREWRLFNAMLQDSGAREIAERVHGERMRGPLAATTQRQAELEEERRIAARAGDHSREELDAQRRATQAFAVAAGRAAMQTGPAVLLEQMASRDAATRAAYERLQENGFLADPSRPGTRPFTFRTLSLADFASPNDSSESDSDKDEDVEGPQGLDARDTGRPEPKSDDDMTVKLDCRICYSQLADIACLPCGHLAMCKWCSDQHSPVLAHDRTRPRRAAGCPVCRKAIRQKVRVFRA